MTFDVMMVTPGVNPFNYEMKNSRLDEVEHIVAGSPGKVLPDLTALLPKTTRVR